MTSPKNIDSNIQPPCVSSLLIYLKKFVKSSRFSEIRADNEVRFKLLTSYDRTGKFYTSDTIQKTNVNPLKRVIFIVGENYDPLPRLYLDKDNYNLFVLETDTEKVGAALGDFIGTLLNKTGERYMDFHLLGIGTAAEACGVASLKVADASGRRVNRITLLDPVVSEEEGVCTRPQAGFVDAVHTDVQQMGSGLSRCGDVDFYVDDSKGLVSLKSPLIKHLMLLHFL